MSQNPPGLYLDFGRLYINFIKIIVTQPLDYAKLRIYLLKYAQTHVWLSILHLIL
jgi:hypothetical protein